MNFHEHHEQSHRLLILASTSPRRRELLNEAGFAFETDAAELEEIPRAGEKPGDFAERMAVEKALAVAPRHASRRAAVLSADTVVEIDGFILGKPRDAEEAKVMLKRLSGKTHRVWTGYALVLLPETLVISGREGSEVAFRDLAESEIAAYVATGEPLDKAGAYAIQGGAKAFVSGFSGSFSNIVGLPMETVVKTLTEHGIARK